MEESGAWKPHEAFIHIIIISNRMNRAVVRKKFAAAGRKMPGKIVNSARHSFRPKPAKHLLGLITETRLGQPRIE